MKDEQLIKKANDYLDKGEAMGLAFMRDALAAQRRLIEKLQAEQPQLATGLKPLKKMQASIYDFIVASTNTNGYPPSTREIAEAVELHSSSTVHGHLDRLEQKGYIKRGRSGAPRAIQIIGKREDVADAVR
ncbi:hypothetical protein J2T15_003767 [Paenibacillus harenae]|uniref:LexA repressor DNA-binding domain-containing protein n=1 Tax=Paenibacillus harenae TaxID=306543 RepID=A0ABT9U4Z2_PAEHA|nr:hypothetical protein [Paenibacillus harenae]MDQ0114312.1 hypothetical protein [Paenibacillus harenae]